MDKHVQWSINRDQDEMAAHNRGVHKRHERDLAARPALPVKRWAAPDGRQVDARTASEASEALGVDYWSVRPVAA